MKSFLALLLLTGFTAFAEPTPSDAKDEPKTFTDPAVLMLEAVQAFEAGKLDDARKRFLSVLEQQPKDLIALVNLGSLEYKAGRLEEAEKHLKLATRVDPDSFPAWLTLGIVAYGRENDDLALAALAQAVLLRPSDPQAHLFLGVTLGRKGWLDGAEKSLARSIELDPTQADAHFNLSVIYLQQVPSSPDLARHHYQKAVKLGAEPDSVVEKQFNHSKEKR